MIFSFQDRTLVRLSFCPCGSSVLKEGIKLGKIYKVETRVTRDLVYVCGGCRRGFGVRGIPVLQGPEEPPAWLPLALFDLEEEVKGIS